MMKGAPEVVIKKWSASLCCLFASCLLFVCAHTHACSSHWMSRGVPVPIDDAFHRAFQETIEKFASFGLLPCVCVFDRVLLNAGERVLGFAHLELDPKEYGPDKDGTYSMDKGNFPQGNYVFLGLISLVDPPKVTVPDAVAQCRTAGVKIVMVTGQCLSVLCSCVTACVQVTIRLLLRPLLARSASSACKPAIRSAHSVACNLTICMCHLRLPSFVACPKIRSLRMTTTPSLCAASISPSSPKRTGIACSTNKRSCLHAPHPRRSWTSCRTCSALVTLLPRLVMV